MPNTFAFVSLFLYLIASTFILKQNKSVISFLFIIFIGNLFLPARVEVDLPLIPPVNKHFVLSILCLIGLKVLDNQHRLRIKLDSITKIYLLIICSMIVTISTNMEPVFNGLYWIQGMTAYDIVSSAIKWLVFITPLYAGYLIHQNNSNNDKLFKVIVVLALIYSLFILIELRLSPQFHTWVYGFFPHNFNQHIRDGGYRPVVFLGHGLVVSIYLSLAVLTSLALFLSKRGGLISRNGLIISIYLFVVLVLSKSLGAILLTLVGVVVLTFCSPKRVSKISLSITIIAVSYPLLAIFQLIPNTTIIDLANQINPDRAISLASRIFQEQQIILHLNEKLMFGWGPWGRYRLINSVTDSFWIINIGTWGVIGFSLFMLLFVKNVIDSNRVIHNEKLKKVDFLNYSAHSLIVSLLLVDQLTNNSMNVINLYFMGAFLGRSKYFLNLQYNNQSQTLYKTMYAANKARIIPTNKY